MEESKLAKKLQIKPAYRVLLVNAPAQYSELLEPLPREAQLFTKADGTFDVVQLFVMNSEELQRDLVWLNDHLRPDTIFWIAYPKKSSGITSDLDMMQSWDETAKYGLSGVAAAAINETWTALRFRPSSHVKRSEVCNSEIENNALGQYIDVKNRIITLPPELQHAMRSQPASVAFFNTLSYTNKKEYVSWVLTAKQDKTRADRINKTVEKLLSGKKNPSDK
jgi:hypothetical protein